MEFVMTKDLATIIPPELPFNFEELKTELAERLEHYKGLVVTEDTIKESKAERANLNKLREAVENRRKEIKREYEKPMRAFEAKVKELVALIDEPINAIDAQLATFEEQRKAEKMEMVRSMYASAISPNIQEIIPLERIMDKKWLNASTSITKIEEEMLSWGKRINSDLLALDTVEPEYKAAVRAKYMETLDLGAAVAHQTALREASRAIQEQTPTKEEQPAQANIEAVEAPKERVYTLRLEMYLTITQANTLKSFLGNQGIQYKKI